MSSIRECDDDAAMHKKTLGAQGATEAVSAGSIAPDAASHAAPTHTPGPWSIEEVHDHEIMIASAATPSDGEWTVASVWRDCAYLQDTAAHNANLIAAAPEMYQALKRFSEQKCYGCESGYSPRTCLNTPTCPTCAARAAIAKAEGK